MLQFRPVVQSVGAYSQIHVGHFHNQSGTAVKVFHIKGVSWTGIIMCICHGSFFKAVNS